MMTVTRPSAWWRCTAVFLARIVMPFSRSRSPESMMRSVVSSPRWVRAPDWRSIASTRVVFPWSTCATMATFLKSGTDSTSETISVRSLNTKTRDARHLKPSKLAELKAKKKCCRSKPRCKRCPVVLHQVRKAELNGKRGKELTKVFKRARRTPQ